MRRPGVYWWDDPPEAGGDYLEDIYECTGCGWEYGA